MNERELSLNAKEMLLTLTLCELLGKPCRAADVERAYTKVFKEAGNDVLRKYSQAEEH